MPHGRDLPDEGWTPPRGAGIWCLTGGCNVSAHLACLWDCGLVARQRHGREVHYRLVPGVAEVLAAADRVLEVAGETVGACPRYGAGIPARESA
jgi:hypothetical protein